MNQGTKFALALAMIMLASIALFVAFHPNSAANPHDLIQEFAKDLEGAVDSSAPKASTPPAKGKKK